MEFFSIETAPGKTGRENIIYRLISSKKLIEGLGVTRVFGVSCVFRSRPETEVVIEDVAAEENAAKNLIFRLAGLKTPPGEIFETLKEMLG